MRQVLSQSNESNLLTKASPLDQWSSVDLHAIVSTHWIQWIVVEGSWYRSRREHMGQEVVPESVDISQIDASAALIDAKQGGKFD